MAMFGMHFFLELKVDVIIKHSNTLDTYILMVCD